MATPDASPEAGGDAYRSGRGTPDAIFSPGSVAVVGAMEEPGGVGRTILFEQPVDGPTVRATIDITP